jgi:hypothetical protein
MEFLTSDQIKRLAPSVFTTEPSPELSKYYTHIPTFTLIEDMEALGWFVIDAKEVKARVAHTKGVQKHILIFRNPNLSITGNDGDIVFPQIMVMNSHDGKSSFQFRAGLFRLVCSNGLVISTANFGSFKIHHSGYTFESLQKTINSIVVGMPYTVECMNIMKNTSLEETTKKEFAKQALLTRFSEDELLNIEIDSDELLESQRTQDNGDDLWTIFNVIQERILKGQFYYISGGKRRKARKISNFKQDIEINSQLFEIALQFVPKSEYNTLLEEWGNEYLLTEEEE